MINKQVISEQVIRALMEDIGDGDVTSALISDHQLVKAVIVSREPMVVCGIPWVNEVFRQLDGSLMMDWSVSEGDVLSAPQSLCQIKGHARSVLSGERVALNFLQTLSGIATITREYVDVLKGTETTLLDTRKTIPGLRLAQKYAVECGGGSNHRMGLYDAFLIKENHIKACGSIQRAIEQARALHKALPIIIEVETIEELKEAFLYRPDRILLDNFSESHLKEAIRLNQAVGLSLEVSGGIDLPQLKHLAMLGIHYVSVGAITKHVHAIDLSLRILENQ